MDLQGWFNYSDLYKQVIAMLRESGKTQVRLAEVGVWKGVSVIRLAQLAIDEFGVENVEIHAIDIFPEGPDRFHHGYDLHNKGEIGLLAELESQGRHLWDVFWQNVSEAGDSVRKVIRAHRNESSVAAKEFEDGQFDFVFIDADHSFFHVLADIRAWEGKTDILAGHDISVPSVREAVVRQYGNNNWYEVPRCDAWTTNRVLSVRIDTIMERVFLGVPTLPAGGVGAHTVHSIVKSNLSRRDVHIRVGGTSLLTFDFNSLMATALNGTNRGSFDWFVMLHADIAPADDDWLDKLIDTALFMDLDVLSAIIPIKDKNGLTSTALDTHGWRPVRFTMKQIESLPDTFTGEWCRKNHGYDLLLNTGLMVIKMSDWCDRLVFGFGNTIIKDDDGKYIAYVEPEDWRMSRWLNRNGLRIGATKAVRALHTGYSAFPNWGAWGTLGEDSINLPFVRGGEGCLTGQEPRESAHRNDNTGVGVV